MVCAFDFVSSQQADYVDAGFTIVIVAFALSTDKLIGGRLMSDNYLPFNYGSNQFSGMQQSLVAVNRSHPLLVGVNSFDGLYFRKFI